LFDDQGVEILSTKTVLFRGCVAVRWVIYVIGFKNPADPLRIFHKEAVVRQIARAIMMKVFLVLLVLVPTFVISFLPW